MAELETEKGSFSQDAKIPTERAARLAHDLLTAASMIPLLTPGKSMLQHEGGIFPFRCVKNNGQIVVDAPVITPYDWPEHFTYLGEDIGDGWIAALNTGFATTVSEGSPDPARRKAYIKIAFDGEGCAERAQIAFDYLDRPVKADTTRSVAVSSEAVAEAEGALSGIAGNETFMRRNKVFVSAWALASLLNQARKPEAHPAHEAGEVERLRSALDRICYLAVEAVGIPVDTEAANAWAMNFQAATDIARAALEDKS